MAITHGHALRSDSVSIYGKYPYLEIAEYGDGEAYLWGRPTYPTTNKSTGMDY